MIKIDVSSTRAVIRSQEPLTVGLAGAVVEFVFDDDWQDLSKMIVFRQEDVTVDVVYTGQTVTIPHEVLTLPGLPLQIGVYGTDGAGKTVIPTVWATTDPVQPAADPVSAVNLEPTSPVYTQLLEAMGDLSGLTTDSKTTLVAAINEANYGSYMVTVKKTDDGWWADKDPETLEMHRKRQKVLICHLTIDDVYLPLVSKGHTTFSRFFFAGVYDGMYYCVTIEADKVTVETKPLVSEEQSGLSGAEKRLLLGLLKNAVFTTDVSDTVSALEEMWTASDEGGGSVPVAGVYKVGSGLIVEQNVTATQTGSVLKIV